MQVTRLSRIHDMCVMRKLFLINIVNIVDTHKRMIIIQQELHMCETELFGK